MPKHKLTIPQTTYGNIRKIIEAYASLGKATDNTQVANRADLKSRQVSLANDFLRDLDIIRGRSSAAGNTITLPGKELAKALKYQNETAQGKAWRTILVNSEVIQVLQPALPAAWAQRDDLIRSLYASLDIMDPPRDQRIGAKAIVNILEISGFLRYTKGKGYKAIANSVSSGKPRSIHESRVADVILDLATIKNPGLASILSRDLCELNAVIEAGVERLSKTCMILVGSVAEALLLERLTQGDLMRKSAMAAARNLKDDRPKDPENPETWDLANLLAVAQQLGLLPSDAVLQLGQLRRWRNLVHPGQELRSISRSRVKPTPQRAENAIGFLKLLAEELER